MSILNLKLKLCLTAFCCFAYVESYSYGETVDMECVPDVSTNTTPREAFGQIYGIFETKKDDRYENTAATACKIQGREDFVETEWIIIAEPPGYLSLKTGSNILSQLNGSKIFCSASDINKENWAPPNEELEPLYKDVTGNINYKCPHLQITITGLRMLKQDLPKLLSATGGAGNVECVTYGNNSEVESDHQWLGKPCNKGEYRYMYNETGDFLCSQCCEDHYWSLKNQRCEACGPCSRRKKRNVWTSCIPEDNCEIPTPTQVIPTTSTTPSTGTAVSPKSTTTDPTTSQYPNTEPMPILTTVSVQSTSSSTSAKQKHVSTSISPIRIAPDTSWKATRTTVILVFILYVLVLVGSCFVERNLKKKFASHSPVQMDDYHLQDDGY